MIIKLIENGKFIQVIKYLIKKLKENGDFNYQWQLILFLLKILMKFVLCIQKMILNIMIDSETDETIKELFKSFLQRYQEELEE